jgi:Fe-S-cluster-containing dehydrogenase component
VVSCPTGAIVFGDLNDPDSEIAQLIATNAVHVIKPEMGTAPQTYYIGLDIEAVEAIENEE